MLRRTFHHRNKRLAGLFHVVDGSGKSKSKFISRSKKVESISVDSNHHSTCAVSIMAKRVGVISIHVVDDSRFLLERKRIFCRELVRLNPVDLTKTSDESHTYRLQPEEDEIVCLFVLPG